MVKVEGIKSRRPLLEALDQLRTEAAKYGLRSVVVIGIYDDDSSEQWHHVTGEDLITILGELATLQTDISLHRLRAERGHDDNA